MYSKYNEEKSVISAGFIKTLKEKIYKKGQLMMVNFILVIWIN